MTEKQTHDEDDSIQREAVRRAKLHLTPLGKVVVGAAGVATVVGGAVGINKVIEHDNNSPQVMDEQVAVEKSHNPSANELALESDANIRFKPAAPLDASDTGNTAGVYKGPDLTISIPEGVDSYVSTDNGIWYGIPAKDIPESVRTNIKDEKLGQDQDGEVWVNQQKASPITTVIGDVATPTENPANESDKPLADTSH